MRWKAEVRFLRLKKNADEKTCFFMEKIDFENLKLFFFCVYGKFRLLNHFINDFLTKSTLRIVANFRTVRCIDLQDEEICFDAVFFIVKV